MGIKCEFLGGRQIYWLILEELARTSADVSLCDYNDITNVKLRGDNLQRFQTDWNKCLLGMTDRNILTPTIKEFLYTTQIKLSVQLGLTMQHYNHGVMHNKEEHTYERLYGIVQTFLEAKRREQNTVHAMGSDAQWGAAGAKGKDKGKGKGKGNGKGKDPNAPPWQNGDCTQYYKYKKCYEGDSCPHKHDRTAYMPKGKGKGKNKGKNPGQGGQNPSGPSNDRGRRSPTPGRDSGVPSNKPKRGNSPSGKLDVAPCRYYLQGKCTKGKDCNNWHPPKCIFYKKGTCKMADKCPFFHPGRPAAAASQAAPPTPGPKAEPKPKPEAKPKGKRRARSKSRQRAQAALLGSPLNP